MMVKEVLLDELIKNLMIGMRDAMIIRKRIIELDAQSIDTCHEPTMAHQSLESTQYFARYFLKFLTRALSARSPWGALQSNLRRHRCATRHTHVQQTQPEHRSRSKLKSEFSVLCTLDRIVHHIGIMIIF